METKQLISVIVPVYNVEKYLDRCLSSIQSQTYNNFECIVIDDGSTDNSGVIADVWGRKDNRFKVLHKKNGGLSDARNFGISQSTGHYVSFIDSDDWVLPNYLESLYTLARSNDADIVVSFPARVCSVDDESALQNERETLKSYTQDEYLNRFFRLKSNATVHYAWGKLFKSNMLVANQFPVGLLNEDVEGFYKALLRANKIVETTLRLYCYYVNPDGITGSTFGDNYLNLTTVWKRIVDITRANKPDFIFAAEYNLKRADFTILCDMLIHGDRSSDAKYEQERRTIQRRLIGELPCLLKGKMQIDRKIAAVAIAIFFIPIRFFVRQIRDRI